MGGDIRRALPALSSDLKTLASADTGEEKKKTTKGKRQGRGVWLDSSSSDGPGVGQFKKINCIRLFVSTISYTLVSTASSTLPEACSSTTTCQVCTKTYKRVLCLLGICACAIKLSSVALSQHLARHFQSLSVTSCG